MACTVQSVYVVCSNPRLQWCHIMGHLLVKVCLILNSSLTIESPENFLLWLTFFFHNHHIQLCSVGVGCNLQSKKLGLSVSPTPVLLFLLCLPSITFTHVFFFHSINIHFKKSLECQALGWAPRSQHGKEKVPALQSWREGYGSELSAKTPGERSRQKDRQVQRPWGEDILGSHQGWVLTHGKQEKKTGEKVRPSWQLGQEPYRLVWAVLQVA